MKTSMYVKAAIAALVLVGGALAAQPAAAVIFHDTAGRAFYYNNWGQPVYYDYGNNVVYNNDGYVYFGDQVSSTTVLRVLSLSRRLNTLLKNTGTT